MENKKMITEHEMFDMEMDSRHGQPLPDPRIMLGNVGDFQNPNMPPHATSSGNFGNHSLDHNGRNSYINWYKSLQNNQPVANTEVGHIAPPNFMCNPYMASSSSRLLIPVPVKSASPDQILVPSDHRAMGARIDEYDGNNQLYENNRGLSKRKNAEGVPGNYNHSNSVASSSSSSPDAELPRVWNRSFQAGANMLNAPYITPPEHPGIFVPTEEVPQQSVRSRTRAINFPHESSLVCHENHLVHGSYMAQPFQPAGNTCFDQYISSIADAGGSSWRYTHSTPALLGISSNRGSQEIGNYCNLPYQNFTSSRNPAANLHNLFGPNRHHYLQPVHGMPSHTHNHHQAETPPYGYGHSVNNNMYHGIMNPPRDGMNSAFFFSRPFPSFEQMYGPPRHPTQAASGYNNALMDVLSLEDASRQYSTFGGENLIDQHRDMRMDIDSMSYEELLALQEQIGEVNTGLSEEFVVKHLNTRIHILDASLSLSIESSASSLENGTCIICQVDFEENERIGNLDCGHDYHANCIKQWLLMKNICPICKTTALAVDKAGDAGP